MKSLLHKSLMQFILCTVVVLLLATPLFYLLTKHFYAEDLVEFIEATRRNEPLPGTDLEEDIMKGVMFQFILITGVLSLSLVLMMRFVSKRLWTPFDDTLKRIESFTLEADTLPQFTENNVKEFTQLNTILTRLMENNLKSYRTQKEFTENASHELQTPPRRLPEQVRSLVTRARPDRSTSRNNTIALRSVQPPVSVEQKSAPAGSYRQLPVQANGTNGCGGNAE